MDGGNAQFAGGPLAAYRARLAAGDLLTDPAQALAAERLQTLWNRLRGYAPHPQHSANVGFFGRLLHREPSDNIPADYPHGLYLVGEVGRGKSMLMDLFFADRRGAAASGASISTPSCRRPTPDPRLAAHAGAAGRPAFGRPDPAARAT